MAVKGDIKSHTSTAVHLNSASICLKLNLQSILQYFLFWLKKKSYLPQISFCLIARKPFQAQFRCHNSTSNADFFGTFKLTRFPIVLNGSWNSMDQKVVDKILGQNFRVDISSRELCRDAILMMSSYRQNCLWPRLVKLICRNLYAIFSHVKKAYTANQNGV